MLSSRIGGACLASYRSVSRLRAASILLGFALAISQASAATLEQLTFDELTDKATDIIYGRVLGSTVQVSGDSIYTHYNVQTQDRWKGTNRFVMDVVLPGGEAGGMRQRFAGVPTLEIGKNYVMFLWTSSAGKTHLLGLTQGLFDVTESQAGEMLASRGVSSELMLDHSGQTVQDHAISIRMSDMSARVKSMTRKRTVQ